MLRARADFKRREAPVTFAGVFEARQYITLKPDPAAPVVVRHSGYPGCRSSDVCS